MVMTLEDRNWSHSALKTYLGCPYKYYREKVVKDIPFDESAPALVHGNKVHKQLEDRLRFKKEMTGVCVAFEHWPVAIENMHAQLGGELKVELEMAFTAQFAETSWFGKGAWMRVKGDVVLANPDAGVGMIFDWKTGKYHGEDGQAEVNAAAVFLRYPKIESVSTSFVYLEQKMPAVTKMFERGQLKDLLSNHMQTLASVVDSHNSNNWPKTPNFQCRWCGVKDCENNGANK